MNQQSKNLKVPDVKEPDWNDSASITKWYGEISLWFLQKSSKEKALSRWRTLNNFMDSMVRARTLILSEKTGDLVARIEQLEERLPK